MKISDSQQEEYKAFLKNIREEREENPNIIKLIFTIIMAILLAIIVCVILVENNIPVSIHKFKYCIFRQNRN